MKKKKEEKKDKIEWGKISLYTCNDLIKWYDEVLKDIKIDLCIFSLPENIKEYNLPKSMKLRSILERDRNEFIRNTLLDKLYHTVDNDTHIYIITDVARLQEDISLMNNVGFVLQNILFFNTGYDDRTSSPYTNRCKIVLLYTKIYISRKFGLDRGKPETYNKIHHKDYMKTIYEFIINNSVNHKYLSYIVNPIPNNDIELVSLVKKLGYFYIGVDYEGSNVIKKLNTYISNNEKRKLKTERRKEEERLIREKEEKKRKRNEIELQKKDILKRISDIKKKDKRRGGK